ncbi:hypothetical protein [Acidocella sp.]|uniref:hypothetical protein n=1 Tax=Acidocella sp. TaxID=50710 RepID=UPI003D053A23
MNGSKLAGWGWPLLVAGIPFAAFFTLGLRYFYINGAWWGDGGILASLMWHNGWLLRLPLVSGGHSFLATHMALVFWLTSGLSWLLPFSRVQFFALFLGAVQALMALPVYYLLLRLGCQRFPAAALAVLFAFNGIVLAASCNPHFELLIVASAMGFLAALACGRVWLARLLFVLCLATREDAGVHLGLLLLVGGLGLRWQGVPWRGLRPLLGYGMAALGCSALEVALQHLLFPGGGALEAVYLGDPPLSGLTFIVLATRLAFYVLYRLYLILPAAVALVLAERWRMPGLVAGFVSCLPWLGLNWLAASPYAGTLSDYYPFPLILALFWPLCAPLFAQGYGVARQFPQARAVLAFILLLGASFVGLWGLQNPQGLKFPASFFNPPSLAMQHATERAMARLTQAKLGHVAVDGSVAALAPDHYRDTQIAWMNQPVPPDVVIFFPRGQGTGPTLRLARQAGLRHFYAVPGTSLRLASAKPLVVPGLALSPWAPAGAR